MSAPFTRLSCGLRVDPGVALSVEARVRLTVELEGFLLKRKAVVEGLLQGILKGSRSLLKTQGGGGLLPVAIRRPPSPVKTRPNRWTEPREFTLSSQSEALLHRLKSYQGFLSLFTTNYSFTLSYSLNEL